MIAEVISVGDVGLHVPKDTYRRGVLEGGGRETGSIAIVPGGRSNSYVQSGSMTGDCVQLIKVWSRETPWAQTCGTSYQELAALLPVTGEHSTHDKR